MLHIRPKPEIYEVRIEKTGLKIAFEIVILLCNREIIVLHSSVYILRQGE